MPKILLVKTSSMGDVIHTLPAVTEIRTHFPDARIDWVVEEGFAELPRLHPGVRRAVPVAVRRWRRQLLTPTTWREFAAFREQIQLESYDLILDCQGLVKSALLSLLAHGPRCGFDWRSAREPLASLAADRKIRVDRARHAVDRNRLLAGLALGYEPDFSHIDYGISAPETRFEWLPNGHGCHLSQIMKQLPAMTVSLSPDSLPEGERDEGSLREFHINQPYAVLLHATSRADKEWPESAWLTLAGHLDQMGFCCVLPWGSHGERARSERLASRMKQAITPPRLNLTQTASLLAGSQLVVGVDTGLSHLAAALKIPLVALYGATDPGLTGVLSSGSSRNLGGKLAFPAMAEVLAACQDVLSA